MVRQHKIGLAKLYVCVATFVGGYHMLSYSGFHEGSLWLFTALSLIFALGMIDAVVNDLLPTEFVAPAVFHTKYLSFIALSGVNVSLLYPSLLDSSYGVEALLYGFNATVAAVVAVLDLTARYRKTHANKPTDDVSPAPSPG